jgi:hypothetical protein
MEGRKVNVQRKLTWMLALVAVVIVLPVVWTLAQAQTGEGSGMQAPGDDTGGTAVEAPLSPDDMPRTPPSPAQVEEQLDTIATGSAFHVLPSAAFASNGDHPDGFHISANDGYFFGTMDPAACLVAPVQLPAGVNITSFEVRLNDYNMNLWEWFDLYRTDLQTGQTTAIATVESPGGYTWGLVALVDDTITYPAVSDMYAYSVGTCARPSIYVYSVRIGYSSRAYVPVMSNSSP